MFTSLLHLSSIRYFHVRGYLSLVGHLGIEASDHAALSFSLVGLERSFWPCRIQNIFVSKLHGMICSHNEDVQELKGISKSILCFGSIYFEEFYTNKGQ